MGQKIIVTINDDVTVHIDGIGLEEKKEIALLFSRTTLGNQDAELVIEATDVAYFRSIGKAIYAWHAAGLNTKNIRVIADGKIIVPDPNLTS